MSSGATARGGPGGIGAGDGVSWREVRREVEVELRRVGVPAPDAEARWIVEAASGLDAIEVIAAGTSTTSDAYARVGQMLRRRSAGEPLQYVLGSWSFRDLDLLVDSRVLIPRPETEVTAQVAIDEAVRSGVRRGRSSGLAFGSTDCVVVDLGTGSGALAITLASELPTAEVWATDSSPEALAVARANLGGAGSVATRVRLAQGDWFDALGPELRGRLRLVVTNPPYVAEHEVEALPPEVARYEPRSALVSGPTGLEAVERILYEAPAWLEPGGVVVCELAPHQAERAVEVAVAAGFSRARVEVDLSGHERVLVAAGPGDGN